MWLALRDTLSMNMYMYYNFIWSFFLNTCLVLIEAGEASTEEEEVEEPAEESTKKADEVGGGDAKKTKASIEKEVEADDEEPEEKPATRSAHTLNMTLLNE